MSQTGYRPRHSYNRVPTVSLVVLGNNYSSNKIIILIIKPHTHKLTNQKTKKEWQQINSN
jgi:hypothetical protein